MIVNITKLLIMQAKNCPKHHRQICIVDLDLCQLICQRCALFQPAHKRHKFIQTSSLSDQANQLYIQFEAAFQSLKLTLNQSSEFTWAAVQTISQNAMSIKAIQINTHYDNMIAELEREKKTKLENTIKEIAKFTEDYKESVNLLVRQRYNVLYSVKKELSESIANQNFINIIKELSNKDLMNNIKSIENSLSIIQIDLRGKLQSINTSETSSIQLTKHTSQKQQLLFNYDQPTSLFDLSFSINKSQKQCMTSECKTEISFITQKCSQSTQQINISSICLDSNSKSTKKIINKSQIKNIFIKNNVRCVDLSQLAMNNRQAMQAIRRCTFNNFVSKIDLSYNEITSQILVLLKREKIQSKYLKNIVIRGLKLDTKALKKEGVNVESIKEGRMQLGEVILQF